MALRRLNPYNQGETVRLRSPAGLQRLAAMAPDGWIFLSPPVTHVDLWLPQVGRWTYRWGDAEEQVLEVIEAPTVETQQDPDPASLPPMTVARRPRF